MPKPSLEGLTPEQIEEMASLYHGLVTNPETREPTLRSTKKLNPRMSIPELDVRTSVEAALKSRDEKIAEMEARELVREVEGRATRNRQSLRDKGYSTEDVAAIEKLMVDRQIPSYDTAAEFFAQQRQLAEPTPDSGRLDRERALSYSLPQDPLAALKTGGKKALQAMGRNSAAAALAEIRTGQVKLH